MGAARLTLGLGTRIAINSEFGTGTPVAPYEMNDQILGGCPHDSQALQCVR